MKFSGHETFPVREGWLHKGMKLLTESPEKFQDLEVADNLGVGRNMAKSIRHWLLVTGLAEVPAGGTRGKNTALKRSSLGQLVWEYDQYFMEEGTWWILHANLVNNLNGATTWAWFFNNFHHERFDRAVCLESLRRFIESAQKRVPSASTLNRDLGCMLLSYARAIPATSEDPEDGADCPFRELGLLSYYRTSGHFYFHSGMKRIPENIFGYVMSIAYPELMQSGKKTDVKLLDVARKAGGPGRVFGLNGETLFETVSLIESISDHSIQIAGMAGDRTIRLPCMSPTEWVEHAYKMNLEGSYA